MSQGLCLAVHWLPRSSSHCPSSSHSSGIIRHPWGWQQSQLQFCPLLAISGQWAPIFVASQWGGKIELHLHRQRALSWLCRRFSHVRSALFLQMRLRFLSHFCLENINTERLFPPLDFLQLRKSFECLWGTTSFSLSDLRTLREPLFVLALFSSWTHVYICVCVADGRDISFTHAFVCEHDFDEVCAYLFTSGESLHRRSKTYMLSLYSEMYWERSLCSWVLLSSENCSASDSGFCSLYCFFPLNGGAALIPKRSCKAPHTRWRGAHSG